MGGLQSCFKKLSVWWQANIALPCLSFLEKDANISCGQSKLLQGTPSSSPFIGTWTSVGVGRSESFAAIATYDVAKFRTDATLQCDRPTKLRPSWVLLVSSWPALAMVWTWAPESSPLACIVMSRVYRELSTVTSSLAELILCRIPPFLFLEEEPRVGSTLWNKRNLMVNRHTALRFQLRGSSLNKYSKLSNPTKEDKQHNSSKSKNDLKWKTQVVPYISREITS